jgi:hypothetical protein
MLLLYCMIRDDVPLRCSGIRGVDGAQIEDAAKNGVRYLYSQWHPARNADEVKQQAVQFHRSLQTVLDETTLIPFRFPTSMRDHEELNLLMSSQSSEYASELQRLSGMVQMKVSVEGSSHQDVKAQTGTEYLKQRQAADAPMSETLEKIKHAMHHFTKEIKQSRRGTITHLYLLIQRDDGEQVRAAIAQLGDLPAKVTFSGPWPPSEFVNCYPEASQARQS